VRSPGQQPKATWLVFDQDRSVQIDPFTGALE
jgi:hypothetical protein